MTEEPGILGNLPRSRPGRRSERRAATAEAAAQGKKAAGASERPAAQGEKAAGASERPAGRRERRPRAEAGTGRGGAPRSREDRRPRQEPASRGAANEPEPGGLVSGAARAAGGAATVGVRVASRLAGGALRRLPRP